MKRLSVMIFIAILFFATSAMAANIDGTVYFKNTKKPVAHALVIFILNDKEVARKITGDDGYYFIRNISEGTYTVKISYKEMTKVFHDIFIGPSGGTFNFEI